MKVFRKKTRSDELVDPRNLKHGTVGWADGPNGREEYVFDIHSKTFLSRAHFLLARKHHAAERGKRFSLPHRRDRSSMFVR